MGFLSQVPLSARFLLYRAVRGGLATLRQVRSKRNTTERIFPLRLGRTNNGGKDLPLPPNFRARWRGCFFLLTPGPTSIRKVHPGFRRKNAAARPASEPVPQQQSTGILFSRNDIPKVSPQQFNRQSVLFANFACFYFKALLSHFVKDKF